MPVVCKYFCKMFIHRRANVHGNWYDACSFTGRMISRTGACLSEQ